MQQGESTHGAESGPPANTRLRRIRIRLSLFFDGTLNNRRNVRARELVQRGPGKAPGDAERYAAARQAVQEHGGDRTSYDNDLSNVVRLVEHVGGLRSTPYDFYLAVYTEGIGTADLDADAMAGYAGGYGATGIPRRVTQGIGRALRQIDRLPGVNRRNTFIELVTVDTCGFSRGAAAARHCVHRVLNNSLSEPEVGGWNNLKGQLEARGWRVGTVEVRAVGLFDTVSSYGSSVDASYADNVRDLRLRAIRQAAAVYQLAAAEEWRKRFSLTSIDSAGDKGRQIFLPGAHSDIGGGYLNGAGERKLLYFGDYSDWLGNYLVGQGFYRRGTELQVTDYYRVTRAIRVNRRSVSARYTLIPLRLMGRFLRRQEVPMLQSLLTNWDPGAVPGRAYIEQYAERAYNKEIVSQRTDWHGVTPTLSQLRHGYLHVSFSSDSAGDKASMEPRWRNFGTRERPRWRIWRHVEPG